MPRFRPTVAFFCIALTSTLPLAVHAQIERSRQKYVSDVNKKLVSGSSVTTDGSTIIFHFPHPDIEEFCQGLTSGAGTAKFIDALRQQGFTKLICTDDHDKRFAFDVASNLASASNPASTQLAPLANSAIVEGSPSSQRVEEFSVGQSLAVVSEGLAIPICDTFDDNLFAATMPVLTIKIANDIAKYDRHPVGGLFTMCKGIDTEPSHPGEVVQIKSISFHGHEYRVRIITAPHAIQRGLGAYQHTVYEPGIAELRFKLNDSDNASRAVRAWLRPTAERPGNTATEMQVPQIREGMSQVEVEAVIGAPDLKFDSPGSTTYTYGKLGIAVVFTDGRVTQISKTH